jgi:hypothetical protein
MIISYLHNIDLDDCMVRLVDRQQYDLKFHDNIDFHVSMLNHILRIRNFAYVFLQAKWLVLIQPKVYSIFLKIKFISKEKQQ